MKIQPFGERVVIKELSSEETTESGLIVSFSVGSSKKGIVEAIGEGVEYIEVGDTVVFNSTSGIPYKDGSNDYKLVSIKDVYGKIIEG